MNYFSKHKALTWLVLVLIVMNTGLMVSLIFLIPKQNADQKETVQEAARGDGLCRMLELTPDQKGVVESIQGKYREMTDPVVASIREKRAALLEELGSDVTDTLRVRKLADSIGEMQRRLQQMAVWQYLELKKVCNPDQCARLSGLYRELYGTAGQGPGKGMGKQHRYRWGRQQ
jgi:Spy/CpxP family protein refolding chaperone